jgi:hypothetical protein
VLLEHEVGGTNDVVDGNPQSMFRRHEPIRELDEESGSLSSFGMMSSPIRIDAHPMMGAGRMKPPEDGVAYFPKGGGVLYSTTHPAGILVPESNHGPAAILAPQKGGAGGWRAVHGRPSH